MAGNVNAPDDEWETVNDEWENVPANPNVPKTSFSKDGLLGVLKDELINGHAPNAIEPTNAAQVMAPMVMGNPGMASGSRFVEPAADVVRSASMGNAPTAGIASAANKLGLINAAKEGGSWLWQQAKPMLKAGVAYRGAQKLGLIPDWHH